MTKKPDLAITTHIIGISHIRVAKEFEPILELERVTYQPHTRS